MNHTHKIIEVKRTIKKNGHVLSQIVMDCPVMPNKVVLTTRPLVVGEEFDPHFSNPEVLARFPPTADGYNRGVDNL